MISHDVNTIQDMTVTSVVNEEGAIIAGNPRDFAAALRIHIRYGVRYMYMYLFTYISSHIVSFIWSFIWLHI